MPSIICDIDNTVLKNGEKPMQNVIGWLNARKGQYKIYMVTARLASDRKRTEKQLKKAGIKYDYLIMNTLSPAERYDYKGAVGRKLNGIDGGVVVAIDNDPTSRAAYIQAGIKTVIDPGDVHDNIAPANVFKGVFI